MKIFTFCTVVTILFLSSGDTEAGTKWAYGVTANYSTIDMPSEADFFEKGLGVGLNFGRKLNDNFLIGVEYRFEKLSLTEEFANNQVVQSWPDQGESHRRHVLLGIIRYSLDGEQGDGLYCELGIGAAYHTQKEPNLINGKITGSAGVVGMGYSLPLSKSLRGRIEAYGGLWLATPRDVYTVGVKLGFEYLL